MKYAIPFLLLLAGTVQAQSPFLTDSTGTITGIEISIPGESYFEDGITRKAKLIRKTEDADLNLTILIHIDCYDAQGRKILDVIEADTTMPETAKQLRRTRFATFGFSKTTRGSFVNPATGDIVPAGTPGSIPELLYFQNIGTAQLQALGLPVTTSTPNLKSQYWMVAAMMTKLITQNGL